MTFLRSNVMVVLVASAAAYGPASALSPKSGDAPQTAALAAQEGSWAVTDTFRSKPGADPQVSTGLIADRRMVGSFLEETLHSAGDIKPLRIDYLGYDAIAGQWRYVSIEARIPVAPMPAASFTRDPPERITLRFEPFARLTSHPAGQGDLSGSRRSLHGMAPIIRSRISTSSWPMARARSGLRTDTIIGAGIEDFRLAIAAEGTSNGPAGVKV